MRDAVQKILYYGAVKEAFHSAVERAERNVSTDDILAMLEGHWTLTAKPEWDEKHRSWKYRLEGVDLEDEALTLIVAVDEELQRLTVVTKF